MTALTTQVSLAMRNLLLLVSCFILQATAEKIPLNILLDADSDEIHYVQGYVTAPATVDLTDTKFKTSFMSETSEPRVTQVLDIALFMIPDDCKKDIYGQCDFASLGVGTLDDEKGGFNSYCCSADTASRGLCAEKDIGRLIVNPFLFTGEQKILKVPTTLDTEFALENPIFEIAKSGSYVLFMGNCDNAGFEVLESGSMEWKSISFPALEPSQPKSGKVVFYAGAITCFVFILTGVGIFWRRVKHGKDYDALQVQIPTATGSDDQNDLELSYFVPLAHGDDMDEL